MAHDADGALSCVRLTALPTAAQVNALCSARADVHACAVGMATALHGAAVEVCAAVVGAAVP